MIPSTDPSTIEIQVAGERMTARADGSLFWHSRSTVFVADVHLGKAASFRSAAVPVPVGTSSAVLERLRVTVEETQASRLVFLGDLWHAKEGRKSEIIDSFMQWRRQVAGIDVLLVEGNHDRHSGVLPATLDVIPLAEPLLDPPFAFSHYPVNIGSLYCLAGHLHPAVRLRGPGRQTMLLPCFWFGPNIGVLPSFGDFTGVSVIEPRMEDRVLVIAEGRVHALSGAVTVRPSDLS